MPTSLRDRAKRELRPLAGPREAELKANVNLYPIQIVLAIKGMEWGWNWISVFHQVKILLSVNCVGWNATK